MMQFASFAELLQQSFSFLNASQAQQLATLLQNTNVPGGGETFGQVFANTMSVSAHIDGAGNVDYSLLKEPYGG